MYARRLIHLFSKLHMVWRSKSYILSFKRTMALPECFKIWPRVSCRTRFDSNNQLTGLSNSNTIHGSKICLSENMASSPPTIVLAIHFILHISNMILIKFFWIWAFVKSIDNLHKAAMSTTSCIVEPVIILQLFKLTYADNSVGGFGDAKPHNTKMQRNPAKLIAR